MAGAPAPPSPPPRWTPRGCARPSARTRRPRWTPPPRPAPCRVAPRSPSNPVARWSWPARRWPLRRPRPHRRRRRRAPAQAARRPAFAVSAARRGSAAAAAPRARPPALPRHGARLRPGRPVGPQRDVLHRRRAGVRRRRGGGRRRPPLGGGARAGPGAGRGVRELAGAARAAHRVEVVPAGLRGSRSTPAHRTAAGPHAGRPGHGLGPRVLDTELLCVRRPDGEWDGPRGVTFADWIRGRRPARPADHRGPRLPHLHPVPPVRPHGHLEVRYLDAQPGRRWALPAAVLAAAAVRPATRDRGSRARGGTVRAAAAGDAGCSARRRHGRLALTGCRGCSRRRGVRGPGRALERGVPRARPRRPRGPAPHPSARPSDPGLASGSPAGRSPPTTPADAGGHPPAPAGTPGPARPTPEEARA